MIETRGLVAAIEAADAMVKAAEVEIISVEQTVAALITIHAVGETAAVQAAVDAGASAATRVGELVSAHVIARPAPETYGVIEIESRPAAGTGPRRSPSKRALSTGSASPEPEAPSLAEIESMTVRELRSLARRTPGLPIQGREIARATKKELLDAFRRRA